jgi:nucleoside-diphosphate-sugar epimerase
MTVGILGCGWLGLALGQHLAQRSHRVLGTTTTTEKVPALAAAGIEPHLLRLTPEPDGDLAPLLAAEVLVLAIPPRAGQQGDDFHPRQIETIVNEAVRRAAQRTSHQASLIYVSSTSVYPDANRELTEADEVLPDHPLARTENLIRESGYPATILRCGGLMGYGRYPAKYVTGRTVTNGGVPVNFVFRDDVVEIATWVLETGVWGETLNVVAPEHPRREAVYRKNCAEVGLPIPTFAEPREPVPFKVIRPARLVDHFGYAFQYPNPLDFPYTKKELSR